MGTSEVKQHFSFICTGNWGVNEFGIALLAENQNKEKKNFYQMNFHQQG